MEAEVGVEICLGDGLNIDEGVREALLLEEVGATGAPEGLRGEFDVEEDVDGVIGDALPLTGADLPVAEDGLGATVALTEGVGVISIGEVDFDMAEAGRGDRGGFTPAAKGVVTFCLVVDLTGGTGDTALPTGLVTSAVGFVFKRDLAGVLTGLLVGGGGRALAAVTFGPGTFCKVGAAVLVADADGDPTAFFVPKDSFLGFIAAPRGVVDVDVDDDFDLALEAETGLIVDFFAAFVGDKVVSNEGVADHVPLPSQSTSPSFNLCVFFTPIWGEKVAPSTSLFSLFSFQAIRSSLCFPAAAISLSTTASAEALQLDNFTESSNSCNNYTVQIIIKLRIILKLMIRTIMIVMMRIMIMTMIIIIITIIIIIIIIMIVITIMIIIMIIIIMTIIIIIVTIIIIIIIIVIVIMIMRRITINTRNQIK